ncbi:hypothetical protein F4825DRAFT_469675 [Nemania diffusa]|nr:hypothetical protein F4825DRAFT_469675 [Nemania diffusa]
MWSGYSHRLNTNSFKSTAKNFCGLLVDFHDSKLSFIHQTVREFLTKTPQDGCKWNWRGRFKLPECHNVMSLSCISYLSLPELDSPTQNPLPDRDIYPFFRYAAKHWPLHYREQDQNKCDEFPKGARKLCRQHRGQPMKWIEFHDVSHEREWTDIAIAACFGLARVVRAILDEDVGAGVDSEARNKDYSAALYGASNYGFPVVVEMLLDTEANVNASISGVSATPLEVGMIYRHSSVVKLLFEKRGDQLEVSESVVSQIPAMEHKHEIAALLLKKRGKQVQINKNIMRGVLANYRDWEEILATILETGEVYVVEGALAVATEYSDGTRFKTLLLEKWKAQVQVTEADMVTAAWNVYATEMMALVFEKLEEKVPVTEAVMVGVVSSKHATDIMTLFLEKLGERVQVTEPVMVEAAKSPDERTIALFLKERGEQIQVTEPVIVAAARNIFKAEKIMALLLKERGEQIQVTEPVIVNAVRNTGRGEKIISLLLEAGKEIQVTEAVLVAASGNKYSGHKIIALLEKQI